MKHPLSPATLLALGAFAAGAGGSACTGGGGDNVLVIRVEADPPGISDIAQLVVSASDGQKRAEVTVDGLRMLTIPPARTVGLAVPPGMAVVTVQVEALNAAGRSFAFGEASASMPGRGVSVGVKLQAGIAPPRFSGAGTLAAITGGTRLKPITWTPAAAQDGPPLAVGLVDTMLGVDCFWQTTSDGKYRCLPDGYRGALAFADAQCRLAVTIVTASRCNSALDLPAFGTLLLTTACPTARSVWRRGAVMAGALYTRNAADACVPAPALRSDQRAYAIEPFEASMMVGATLKPVGSGPLAPVYLEAEDGARQLFAWRNSALNTDCQVGLAADGRVRCLPVPLATVGTYWADSNCTQPAARTTRSTCTGENAYVASGATGTCPGGTRISRAGPKQMNAYQRDASNACTPAALSSSDLFMLGPELPPDRMETASLGMLPGTQRLRPLTETTSGGTAVRPEYWDAKLRTVCVPGVAADGRVHCLPRRTEPVRAFVEPGCMGNEVVLRRLEDCETTFAEKENTICPVGKRIFPLLLQPHTGPLWANEAGPCIAANPRSGIQALQLGAELPATDFVELRRAP